MLDERLGRHSVAVASLGVIPALAVIIALFDGISNPGVTHGRWLVWAFFATPPLAAFALGWFNSYRYRVLKATALAAAALLMVGVWYAILFLPAAALCTVMHHGSCM